MNENITVDNRKGHWKEPIEIVEKTVKRFKSEKDWTFSARVFDAQDPIKARLKKRFTRTEFRTRAYFTKDGLSARIVVMLIGGKLIEKEKKKTKS